VAWKKIRNSASSSREEVARKGPGKTPTIPLTQKGGGKIILLEVVMVVLGFSSLFGFVRAGKGDQLSLAYPTWMSALGIGGR